MMYYDQFNTGKRIQKLRRERYLMQEGSGGTTAPIEDID